MAVVVITGAAGFLGSHLCDRFLAKNWKVFALDSLLTGDADNLAGCFGQTGFTFKRFDITNHIDVPGPVDWVLHFASPASPSDYLEHPIHTLKVGSLGTLRTLGLARAKGSGFLLASTSEVYGDPQVHPQHEGYWGHVNPVGPRGVYDEAKRFAEAMTMSYHRVHGISVRIARIFNTYGPRMRMHDGRAVPTFIRQALRGEPLTVHGDGSQTRSLCYVEDMVEGLWRLVDSGLQEPVNLGNPEEVTVSDLAGLVRRLAGNSSEVVFIQRPVDDPQVRCPDIGRARADLGWEPRVSLHAGLERTIAWAREAWD